MVNKKRDGVSELYSLVEFKDEEGNKVRRDEALARNYLTGNYGAIPALKPMKILKGRADKIRKYGFAFEGKKILIV